MPRRIGKRFYTDFKFQGRRIRQAMPEARTVDQAKRLEAQIRDGYFEGKYGNPAATTVFIQFAENVWMKWSRENKKSWKEDRRNLVIFRAFFGNRTFSEISTILIEKFKRQRLAEKTHRGTDRKPSSVNRELEALSKIFNLGIQQKITTENPCRRVRHLIENNARTRYLSPEEEVRLFDAILLNQTLTVIVTIAINTGMRKGEILKLEWQDVDFSSGLIHIRETKTGHNRYVPMSQTIRQEIQSLPRSKDSKFVFPGTGASGHLTEIKKAWASALKFANIEDFKFHDLRHTAGTRLAEVGTHPMVMMEILGHKNLQTTKRYTHATTEAKQTAINALEKFKRDVPKPTRKVIGRIGK